MVTLGLVVLALLVGFGLGRVKNAQKLEKVRVVIARLESGFITDARAALNEIRKHI